MRRGYDLLVGKQGSVLGRLGGVDIQRRAADLAGFDGRVQGRGIDQLAARAVDDPHAVFHLADQVSIDDPGSLRREREVQAQVVGTGQQRVELEQFYPGTLCSVTRHERVVCDHLHAEGARALGDLPADAPESDDPEGLAEDLVALKLLPFPKTGLGRCVGGRHGPG